MSEARGRPSELSEDEAAWARDIAGKAAKPDGAPAVKGKKKAKKGGKEGKTRKRDEEAFQM